MSSESSSSRDLSSKHSDLRNDQVGTCPTKGGLKARLRDLRDKACPGDTPTGRRRLSPPLPHPPKDSEEPDRKRPGRSPDPLSTLLQLVAILAAGLPPIHLETDTLLSPGEVCELLPPRRRGRKAHKSTVFRWMTHGYKGLRLPYIQVGHQRCTGLNALSAFLSALTAISRFERGESVPSIIASHTKTTADRPARETNRLLRTEEELRRRHGI